VRLAHRHEGRVRHHLVAVVLDEQVHDVRREAAELGPRLHVDLEEPAEADEALLVGAADEDVEVVERRADGDALLHRELVVDHQLVLGIVRREEGEEPGELRAP
jgi:hypothetical protein